MKKEYPRFVGAVVALLGLVLGFLGFYRGEADTVFAKAIRICLECIGIG
ncbi:MAG: thioredoxin [Clostridia bacterium]|nr:thioredoxin [Clostridia bacterium]